MYNDHQAAIQTLYLKMAERPDDHMHMRVILSEKIIYGL